MSPERKAAPITAITLREACRRLSISYRTGQRYVAEGKFPIPHLPRRGRQHLRFSEDEVNFHLTALATREVGTR